MQAIAIPALLPPTSLLASASSRIKNRLLESRFESPTLVLYIPLPEHLPKSEGGSSQIDEMPPNDDDPGAEIEQLESATHPAEHDNNAKQKVEQTDWDALLYIWYTDSAAKAPKTERANCFLPPQMLE